MPYAYAKSLHPFAVPCLHLAITVLQGRESLLSGARLQPAPLGQGAGKAVGQHWHPSLLL